MSLNCIWRLIEACTRGFMRCHPIVDSFEADAGILLYVEGMASMLCKFVFWTDAGTMYFCLYHVLTLVYLEAAAQDKDGLNTYSGLPS